jgi:hypothetical protein
VIQSKRMRTQRLALTAGAVIAALALTAPVSARGILDVFTPKSVRTITVTPGDQKALRALPPLEAFGTVLGTRSPGVSEVASAADIASQAHFKPRVPADVPSDIKAMAHYSVTSPVNTTFTFSAAKTRAWATEQHIKLAPMPANLNGSVVRAQLAPIAMISYGARSRRGHQMGTMLTVVQAPVPHITTTGATVRDITSYLLAQPGMPADVAAQLRSIGDPSQTLPIPIQFDKQTAKDVTVDGVQGMVIGDQTGIGSVVVWQKNGMFYSVGGTYSEDRILAIASSLH